MGFPTSRCLVGFLILFSSGRLMMQADPFECSVEWEVDWDDIPDDITLRDILKFLGLAWNTTHWLESEGLICVNFGPLLNEYASDDIVRRECDTVLRALRQVQKSSNQDSCSRTSEEEAGEECLESGEPSMFPIDPNGMCSDFRTLLHTPVENIIGRLKEKIRLSMTDVLKRMHFGLKICDDLDPDTAFLVDILDVLANSTGSTCRFFSQGKVTRAEFSERATKIIDNAMASLSSTSLCEGLLTALADRIDNDPSLQSSTALLHLMTSFNPISRSHQRELCGRIADAFDPDSGSDPTPNDEPMSLENFIGVVMDFLRSGSSMAEGIALGFCDMLSEEILDVIGICGYLRELDLAAVEKTCLQFLHRERPMYRGITIPMPEGRLLPHYVATIGWEIYRRWFIGDSKEYDYLNSFFDSGVNFQSVTRLTVRSLLENPILPGIHIFCKNDLAYHVHLLASHFFTTSEIKWMKGTINPLILSPLGSESFTDLCKAVASGIDPSTNVASKGLVERFERELSLILTDERRCKATANALLNFSLGRSVDADYTFLTLTGYVSTGTACRELREFFSTPVCYSQ